MTTNNQEPLGGKTPRVDALMSQWSDDGAIRGAAFMELRDLARELERAASQQAGAAGASDVQGEPAPPNSLPNWSECALRAGNSEFIAKRVAEGGYGPEHDSKLATQLHRFIYEYDDADPYRSAWFLHRLELVIEEVKLETQLARLKAPAGENIGDDPKFCELLAIFGHNWTNGDDKQAASRAALIAHIIAWKDAQLARHLEAFKAGCDHATEHMRKELAEARAQLARQRQGNGEPVRYEHRMRAPNGNRGDWHACNKEFFDKFSAAPDVGDGFAYETRALYTTPTPQAQGEQPDEQMAAAVQTGFTTPGIYFPAEDRADELRSVAVGQAQGEPVAYLHQVVCDDGEPDQALSFAPDNFPLAGKLGFRSISHRPLFLGPAPQADEVTEAARDVLAERQRQMQAEGWTPEHDDEHGNCDMAEAAACYITGRMEWSVRDTHQRWPWSMTDWKPKDRRRNLVRAGALLLAEIERLDRAALKRASLKRTTAADNHTKGA